MSKYENDILIYNLGYFFIAFFVFYIIVNIMGHVLYIDHDGDFFRYISIRYQRKDIVTNDETGEIYWVKGKGTSHRTSYRTHWHDDRIIEKPSFDIDYTFKNDELIVNRFSYIDEYGERKTIIENNDSDIYYFTFVCPSPFVQFQENYKEDDENKRADLGKQPSGLTPTNWAWAGLNNEVKLWYHSSTLREEHPKLYKWLVNRVEQNYGRTIKEPSNYTVYFLAFVLFGTIVCTLGKYNPIIITAMYIGYLYLIAFFNSIFGLSHLFSYDDINNVLIIGIFIPVAIIITWLGGGLSSPLED